MESKDSGVDSTTLGARPLSEHEKSIRAAALAAIADELAALDAARLPPYTLDAEFAASTVLAAMTTCAPLLAVIARLPEYDWPRTQRLPTYARALQHVDSLVRTYAPPPVGTDKLLSEARALRLLLLSDAEGLVLREQLDAETVAKIRAGSGHLDLVRDLQDLHTTLAPFVGGRVEAVHHERSSALAELLSPLLNNNTPQTDPVLTKLYAQRQKVGWLTVEAYEDFVAAVEFVRRATKDGREWTPTLRVSAATRTGGAPSPSKPVEPKPQSLTEPTVAAKPRKEPGPHDPPSDWPFIDPPKEA